MVKMNPENHSPHPKGGQRAGNSRKGVVFSIKPALAKMETKTFQELLIRKWDAVTMQVRILPSPIIILRKGGGAVHVSSAPQT